jgi:hypothetical protein
VLGVVAGAKSKPIATGGTAEAARPLLTDFVYLCASSRFADGQEASGRATSNTALLL